MKKIVVFVLLILVGVGLWWALASKNVGTILNPMGEQMRTEKPYDKYSFERLAQRGGVASKIEIVGNKFYYYSEGRRISGEINLPSGPGPEGLIVMARGYVDKEIYKTGIGTHNAAKYYADHGYITLAPDFSGYGESDPEDENALGARLTKPVEILDLIASVRADNNLPAQAGLPLQGRDVPIYLWGHSNGGQIMLSVAEILGMSKSVNLYSSESVIRGMTLWAPVSKPFPYNILYYTDEADDQGKWLRGEIAKFEQDYDVYNYSIDRYMDKINIPLQIHQGSADDAVPKKWSDTLAESLKSKDKRATYYVYPGADHNMKPGWDTVVSRDIDFFLINN